MARGNRENSLNAKATVALRELVLQAEIRVAEGIEEPPQDRWGAGRHGERVAHETMLTQDLCQVVPGTTRDH